MSKPLSASRVERLDSAQIRGSCSKPSASIRGCESALRTIHGSSRWPPISRAPSSRCSRTTRIVSFTSRSKPFVSTSSDLACSPSSNCGPVRASRSGFSPQELMKHGASWPALRPRRYRGSPGGRRPGGRRRPPGRHPDPRLGETALHRDVFGVRRSADALAGPRRTGIEGGSC